LGDFLSENNAYGYQFYHIHIDLLMDSATDYEAESNKMKTQARRAERMKQPGPRSNGDEGSLPPSQNLSFTQWVPAAQPQPQQQPAPQHWHPYYGPAQWYYPYCFYIDTE